MKALLSLSRSRIIIDNKEMKIRLTPFSFVRQTKRVRVDPDGSADRVQNYTAPVSPRSHRNPIGGEERGRGPRSRLRLGPLGLVVFAFSVALLFSAAPAPAAEGFGVETFETPVTEQSGTPAAQAGSHPYAITTTIIFDNHFSEKYKEENGGNGLLPNGNPKQIEVNLPVGMIVNPTATPTRCTEEELLASAGGEPGCPESSAVGVTTIAFGDNLGEKTTAVYNMVPPPGAPAELGAAPIKVGVIVRILGNVRTGSDYGVSGTVSNIAQFNNFYATTLTLWGDPSAESHDSQRGLCAEEGGSCPLAERSKRPFLTMPGSCPGTAQQSTVRAYSWQEPGLFTSLVPYEGAPMTGCDLLRFAPTISVQPQTSVAASPTGLSVDLRIPQNDDLEGLAEANLKDATVTLPAGVLVNPSEANGLVGCALEGAAGVDLHSSGPAHCPAASKIGSVEVVTPLLEKPLKGAVYIAQQGNAGAAQGSNPFGSLLALYIVAEGSGVVVKLAGEVKADPSTGQLTTTFLNNPQLPFEDFKLEFFGGSRAPLLTPQQCGTYTTQSSLAPWSGTAPVSLADSFAAITSGCTSGFAPSFTAATVNGQAGAFSPFMVTFSRGDGEQRLAGITVTTPPGLAGIIANIPRCGEAQANAGTCSAASQIGEASATAGAGPDPVPVTGGRVYLTGPYEGDPFGLSIVVPAVAGPFNLGDVVVRASIAVDPHTAALTVRSDPLPQMIDTSLGGSGIPTDLRTVNVNIDRPDFMFNPTDCRQMSVAGTLTSVQGASAAVGSRFEAANCAALAFKPGFSVVTHAGHTRANGEYLHVTVRSGSGQSNIARVHVELPKVLPSRVSTLKLACAAAQFAANPAGCPAGSFVGTATAYTPVLAKPLTGPAIFVSHGGAAFPDLDVVLQGEGVTVILTGNTFIDEKTGVTSSTFATVPDVPVTRFDLVLPAGPHSALGGNGNLCYRTVTKRERVKVRVHGRTTYRVRKVRHKVRVTLVMPTTITGQNGAVVKRTTRIAVAGCPALKAKAAYRAPHKARLGRKR